MESTPNIVYNLTHPAMSNFVKVGITNFENVKSNMAQLCTTGLSLPFGNVYVAKVANYENVEKALHIKFCLNKINRNEGKFASIVLLCLSA